MAAGLAGRQPDRQFPTPWHPSGKFLAFTTGASFSADKPQAWSPEPISSGNHPVARVVRGEKRLLVLRSPTAQAELRSDKVVITSGFFDELRRLTAPTGPAAAQ